MSEPTVTTTSANGKRNLAAPLQLAAFDNRPMLDTGLLLARLGSLPLFLHGVQKAMGFEGFVNGLLVDNPVGSIAPHFIGALVVAGQLLLPLALALGLFTRLSGLLLALLFGGIIVFVNIPMAGFIDHQYGGITFESSLLYFGIGLTLLFTGAGRWSLDSKMGSTVRY